VTVTARGAVGGGSLIDVGSRIVTTRASLALLIGLTVAGSVLGAAPASAVTIPYYGSMGAKHLAAPIVGIAATGDGKGYWELGRDGGIFSFGDARYHGSLGGATHSAPIVGMATTPSGNGYWLADAAGAVTGFGDAVLARAAARVVLPASEHVDSIVAEPAGEGYWLSLTRGAATNPKVEAAIAWFESRMGSSSYEGRCETAVENAFGTDSRYPTAIANWYAQPVHHADWQNAPRGAIVYYDTSSSGHVAISLGDGRVVSTSINGRIGIAATGFLQNPLGWADSPFL